jgi:hypothetical protein
MAMNGEDEKLHELGARAGQLLRTSADELDGATRSRLAQARAAAVAQVPVTARPPVRYLLPAGALAGAAAVTVLLLGRMPSPADVNEAAPAALMDLELLADADALDLAEESDLEFVEWAAGISALEGAGG